MDGSPRVNYSPLSYYLEAVAKIGHLTLDLTQKHFTQFLKTRSSHLSHSTSADLSVLGPVPILDDRTPETTPGGLIVTR